MGFKIQIRQKSDFIDAEISAMHPDYIEVVCDRNFVENFFYDIKIPDITGEELIKAEVKESQQVKLRTYQLKMAFLDLKPHIKKKIDAAAQTQVMKKFELAVARAVSRVLQSVLKTELTDINYSLADIEKYHFHNSIVVSVIGEIRGSAILSFDENLRKLVAAQMWSFTEIEVDEESIIEALKEFANIVLGNTTTILSNNMGVKCDIKSPVVLHDKYIESNASIKLHQVSMSFKISGNEYSTSLIFLHGN